ncbi:hypothetical protein CJ030_MR1G005238 [Morella rubra]|uniref:TRF2/HOY1 PH-like domain-containing protein n=1 Tax=Morella rubra TaxID=262757 RepID=A0A6A1WPT2_9ROSI|nr:hypothetical protein CJ030_MR1G005238 [Morella rubra]
MDASRAKNTKYGAGLNHSSTHGGVQTKAGNDSEKLKASNFCTSLLRIGSWKKVAEFEGNLVAKCYYGRKKLVWEIIEEKSKKKLEIQWCDILAIRALIAKDMPGILEIELNNPPKLHEEINSKPKTPTLWNMSSDFTNDQARIHRRHYLEFPPGVLDKPYKKLLRCDDRLLMLSQKPFPSLGCPYFYSDTDNETMEFSLDGYGSHINSSSQLPFSSTSMPMVGSQQVQSFQQMNYQPCFGINDSTSSIAGGVRDFNGHGLEVMSDSQSSFLSPHRAMHQTQTYQQANGPCFSVEGATSAHSDYNRARGFAQDPFSTAIATSPMHCQNYSTVPAGYVGGAGRVPITDSDEILDAISNELLSDVQEAHNCFDQNQYLAKVNSLASLIDLQREENNLPANITQRQSGNTQSAVIRVNSFGSLITVPQEDNHASSSGNYNLPYNAFNADGSNYYGYSSWM